MTSAFPLQWPEIYARTPRSARKWSRWKQTLAAARDMLQEEVRMMKASNLIISSNQPLKQNGEMRADAARFREEDTGVAVYFDWKDRSYVMCCDVYLKTWENVYAIARTINALRQIDRDGVSEFLERAFTGFPGLPAPGESTSFNCWNILGIPATKDVEAIRAAFRHKSKTAHPDGGGSAADFYDLQLATKQAEQEAAAV